mmetsp:Transcript_10634/g.43959  ORF Transcript_10634/g.43959 Transcript_10634/m.43959 type:complete len:314 (+) Transcript_10634:918-1859(+)
MPAACWLPSWNRRPASATLTRRASSGARWRRFRCSAALAVGARCCRRRSTSWRPRASTSTSACRPRTRRCRSTSPWDSAAAAAWPATDPWPRLKRARKLPARMWCTFRVWPSVRTRARPNRPSSRPPASRWCASPRARSGRRACTGFTSRFATASSSCARSTSTASSSRPWTPTSSGTTRSASSARWPSSTCWRLCRRAGTSPSANSRPTSPRFARMPWNTILKTACITSQQRSCSSRARPSWRGGRKRCRSLCAAARVRMTATTRPARRPIRMSPRTAASRRRSWTTRRTSLKRTGILTCSAIATGRSPTSW